MTTPTNSPVRAATSPELVKFRGEGQYSRLGIAIHHPVTIYTARVNQSFTATTLDRVNQLTYDGGSGTLSDVLIGMTALIGSAAGLADKGVCRIRQAPTSTILYISEQSNIQFANNDYITIIDRFDITQRDVTIDGDDIKMDYDIVFGDQSNGGIIPRLGPVATVINQTTGTITFTPPDPSLSNGYDGELPSTYFFSAPGAVTTSDMTDPSLASWTYPLTADGEYRWSLDITDTAGRVTTAYRRVFVNPSEIDFALSETPSADYDSGGWSFGVTLFDNATQADIYDRALVVLYAKDYYAGTLGSIGKISGYENVVCVGWVDMESVVFDSEKGSVSFSVHGPAYWLQKIRAMPFELQNTTGAATTWKEIQNMTVDKALAQILYWTSTAPLIFDCFFTYDTNIVQIFAQPAGSLYDQITAIALPIFAKGLSNSYGQFFVEIDQQVLDSSDRSAITTVMDITTADYEAPLTIEHNTSEKNGMVELSGVATYDGVAVELLYARAPGTIGERYGVIQSNDNFVFADQTECNRIAGCLLAIANNPYEQIEMAFAQNNRLIDICPQQYCTITVADTDNPRGIALTAARLIPRRVSYSFDSDSGTLRTLVGVEVEAIGNDGITYIPPNPIVENVNTNYNFNDVGLDFPALDTWFPPYVGPAVDTPCASGLTNQFSLSWSPTFLDGTDPDKLVARVYFPCKIRGTMGGSYIRVGGVFYGDAQTNYGITAIKGGAPVLSGSLIERTEHGDIWEFVPLSDTEIDGFELTLTAGVGSSLDFTVGSFLEGGTVAATADINNLSTVLVVGSYYAISGSGGPWKKAPTWIDEYAFYCSVGSPPSISGAIGLDATSETTTAFTLAMGALGITGWALNAHYGVIIFQANDTFCAVASADTSRGDNSGSLGYSLFNVTARGRRIALQNAGIHNVCAL